MQVDVTQFVTFVPDNIDLTVAWTGVKCLGIGKNSFTRQELRITTMREGWALAGIFRVAFSLNRNKENIHRNEHESLFWWTASEAWVLDQVVKVQNQRRTLATSRRTDLGERNGDLSILLCGPGKSNHYLDRTGGWLPFISRMYDGVAVEPQKCAALFVVWLLSLIVQDWNSRPNIGERSTKEAIW